MRGARTWIVGVVVGGLAVTAAFNTGRGAPSTKAEFAPGSAWLWSAVPGQLTLLDGVSGQIVVQLSGAQLPGIQPGDQSEVAQAGAGAYVVDGSTGVVDRVDGATDRATTGRGLVPSGTSIVSLYAAAHFLYVVDGVRGRITVADPVSLKALGSALSVRAEPGTAVLDPRGVLWVVDALTGRVVEVAGTRVRETAVVADQASRATLVLIRGRAALVDYGAAVPALPAVRVINPGTGTGGRAACLGVAPADDLTVAGGSPESRMWVVSGTTGLLRETDLSTGKCRGQVVVSAHFSRLESPVEEGGKVFVADETAGQVVVVDVATLQPVAPPASVVPPGSRFDLFAKDGMVFFNDPSTQDAGIIRPDGTVVRVTKYLLPKFPSVVEVTRPGKVSDDRLLRGSVTPGARSNTSPYSLIGADGAETAPPVVPQPRTGPLPAGSGRAPGYAPNPPESRVDRLQITTTSLPPAIAGRPYTATLDAAGGKPPYTWTASGLPSGLRLDDATGVVGGTPGEPGFATVTVVVIDRTGTTVGIALPLTVYGNPRSPPAVSGVIPNLGPPAGGNTVTVNGENLVTATAVRFGTMPATNLTVNSDTSVTVDAPPGQVGTVVDVTVTAPDGTSVVSVADQYTYTASRTPTVSALSQNEGLALGGGVIDVTGTNFSGATQVDFGAVPAESFTVLSKTSLVVTTPRARPGQVDVTVTSHHGTSPITPADRYTFVQDLSATTWLNLHWYVTSVLGDADGNVFMSVNYNGPGPIPGQIGSVVFLRRPNGTIVRYAGTGGVGYNGDNIPAADAELNNPANLALDAAGNLYIADQGNFRVRRVDRRTGIITTVAGNGYNGIKNMGGPAGAAGIANPLGITFGPNGDLYFSSRNAQIVCRVSAVDGVVSRNSTITVYAGQPLLPSDGLILGDGGPATKARLWMPAGLATDAAGNLYIADDWDHRVRKVKPDSAGNIISTLAGGGSGETTPSPQNPLKVDLFDPTSVAFDPFGDLYIGEYNRERVDLLTPSDEIYSAVGGEPGPGDGNPPETARFGQLGGISFVPSPVPGEPAGGTLYVCDPNNTRVAVVT